MKINTYKLFIVFLLSYLTCIPTIEHAQSQEKQKLILVLDVSGSMWGQIEGKSKIEIARSSLMNLVKDWDEKKEVGLIAYGHRTKGDCEDIEEVLPVGKLNKEKLKKIVDGLTPKGMTPLSASVKKAAELLKYTENKATVVLISDGIETCKLDPCSIGEELEQSGVDFTAHVIGFDVSKIEDQKGLRCLAENTGGSFIAASNSRELNEALTKVIATPVPPTPTSVPTNTHTAIPTSTTTPRPSATMVVLPAASLVAPDNATKGTVMEVNFKSEQYLDGYLYIYKKGMKDSKGYTHINKGKDGQTYSPAMLRLPSEPGEYELIWKHKDMVFATKALEIKDAVINLNFDKEAIVGTELSVSISAPADLDGYLHLYAKGGDKSITYEAVRENKKDGGYNLNKIRMPRKPGNYEVKWITGKNEVIASGELLLKDSEFKIISPSEVMKATPVEISLEGPSGLDGYVYIYKKGFEKNARYEKIYSDSEGKYKKIDFKAPADIGDYILSWEDNRRDVYAKSEFKVIDAVVKIIAPDSAPKATEINISLNGPDGLEGYVYLYLEGKDKSVTYERIHPNKNNIGYKTSKLRLPYKPGTFELVFKTMQEEELSRAKITVTDSNFSISSPDEVSSATEFEIKVSGPPRSFGYIQLYKKGAKDSVNYVGIKEDALEDYETMRMRSPEEVGEYELKWVIDEDKVLATKNLAVK